MTSGLFSIFNSLVPIDVSKLPTLAIMLGQFSPVSYAELFAIITLTGIYTENSGQLVITFHSRYRFLMPMFLKNSSWKNESFYHSRSSGSSTVEMTDGRGNSTTNNLRFMMFTLRAACPYQRIYVSLHRVHNVRSSSLVSLIVNECWA